jgi:hypothetical protein
MKATLNTNRVIYPDVSHEITDLVSQQPEPKQVAGVRVKRLKLDEYRAIQAAGLSKLDELSARGSSAPSPYGFVPRPADWNSQPDVFYQPEIKEELRSAAVGLNLTSMLDEMLSQVAGQITDLKAATQDVNTLLSRDYKGMVFRSEPGMADKDPLQFIQERSLPNIDELRQTLSGGGGQRSILQDSMQKAMAMLQIRAKLDQLGKLGNFIDRCFSELDFVDLGKLKTPQLC